MGAKLSGLVPVLSQPGFYGFNSSDIKNGAGAGGGSKLYSLLAKLPFRSSIGAMARDLHQQTLPERSWPRATAHLYSPPHFFMFQVPEDFSGCHTDPEAQRHHL